jgi:crotonobetainyl-CoA:carnitine CoA-transferase CaiB-like acyl-CoA transferase
LVFATRDGYITAGAVSDVEWAGLCRALKRDELIEDARFATAAARVENVVERRDVMNSEIAKWPSAEILARLDREGVPSAPVLSRSEVIEDAQVKRNQIIELHDDSVMGTVRQPRPAARFDSTPAAIRSMAPYLGADNDAILLELGYSPDEADRLGADRVVHREGEGE